MYLENENIKLRAPEPEDLELLYTWENDSNLWTLGNTLEPFSRYTLKQYIESSHLSIYEKKQLRFMIIEKSNQKPVGAIDIFDFEPFHNRAGVGILIYNNSDRNKGIATQALQILIDYCFNFLQIHQLHCSIEPENQASIKLFEKCGFEKTGERKQWLKKGDKWGDEFFYQLIK